VTSVLRRAVISDYQWQLWCCKIRVTRWINNLIKSYCIVREYLFGQLDLLLVHEVVRTPNTRLYVSQRINPARPRGEASWWYLPLVGILFQGSRSPRSTTLQLSTICTDLSNIYMLQTETENIGARTTLEWWNTKCQNFHGCV
jgi:hypothetical protein